jgi:DNA-directed RNA polymerase subunit H (RpoH/RPB5)
MFLNDPVSKYYNLKIDDIVRIERPSINSGIAIDYRVVVPGSIYK